MLARDKTKPNTIGPTDQARDTGLAIVLASLLVIHLTSSYRWIPLSITLLVTVMVWPTLFRPIAGPWLAIAGVTGTVMSTVILTTILKDITQILANVALAAGVIIAAGN